MNKEFCLVRPGKKRECRDTDPEGSFPLQLYERQHTRLGKHHYANQKEHQHKNRSKPGSYQD
jgi:hypothetical protein